MRKFKIANGLVTGVALCLLLIAGACSLGDDAVEDAGAPSDAGLSPSQQDAARLEKPLSRSGGGGTATKARPPALYKRGGGGLLMPQSIVRGMGLRMARDADSALAPWPSPGVGEELWIIATAPRKVHTAREPDHPGSGALMATRPADGEDKTKVAAPPQAHRGPRGHHRLRWDRGRDPAVPEPLR